jgi:hypothetical protein
MRVGVFFLVSCIASTCQTASDRAPAAPAPKATAIQAEAAAAPEAPKVNVAAPAPTPKDPCEQVRARFYALQQSSLACERDDQCDCVSRIEVSGGGLLGVLSSAVPGLSKLANEYSRKKCPISCRASNAPVCHAHCAAGACTP